jgi:iron(III) transport system ATP-binding protein
MTGGLHVTGLYKAFGSQPVLRGLDLDVPEGSLTAILGASGSGKTTLLRLLAGFERPDRGIISVGGRIVDDGRLHLAPQGRGIGYVPQEGALFPHLTVAANIGFGLPRRRRRVRVAELVELTGLGELTGRYPHQLSGGQQQRVALARALAPRPSLMLLDEPFSSLDAALRASVRSEVADVLATAGTTALLVTHDQDEALSMADRVAVLRHGRFVQAGSPDDIYTRPADPEVAAFVGDANLLPGVADGGGAQTALGHLVLTAPPPPGAGRLLVLVRPEHIAVFGSDAIAESGGVAGVAGVVRHCDYHGHDTVLLVDVASADATSGPVVVQVRVAGPPRLAPGAAVILRVDAAAVAWSEDGAVAVGRSATTGA